MAADALGRVREIVADVTLLPVSRIADDAAAGRLDGWDSLAQINIIAAVEAEFGITFGAEEVHSLDSVGKIAAALKKAGLGT